MNPERLARQVAACCPDRNELFFKRTVSRSVEWDRDEVKSVNGKQDAGAGLRVQSDDRIGFAHANQSRLTVPDLVERARRVRALKSPDRNRTLPGLPASVREDTRDRYDETLDSDPRDRVEALTEQFQQALDHDEVRTLQGSYEESATRVYLFVDGRPVYRSARTSYSFGCWTICERNGEVESGYDGQSFVSHDRLDPDQVLRQARRRGRELLGAEPPDEYHGPAVLTDRVASSLLGLAADMVNGETILKNRSDWGNEKLGETLADESVSIVDDPTRADLTGSTEYDAYGEPVEPVPVIQDGEYRQFLTNSYVANKLDCENNHRTSRGFQSTPGVGTTNFLLQPGDHDAEALREQLGDGPVITGIQPGSGMDAVNGRFSVGCQGYFRQPDGSREPFTEGTLSGRLADLLGSVEAIGDELPPGKTTASPPLLVNTIHLGGSG